MNLISNNKEKLDKKNENELEGKYMREYDGIYSAMKDYYGIILLGKFNESDIEKMFNSNSLLEELAIQWLGDARTLELQEQILKEYLQKI